MKFIVQLRNQQPPAYSKYPHVKLVQNNWDDYGYKTTFDSTLYMSSSDEHELGTVKIMKDSQTGNYTEVPKRPFEELGPEFCSLGANMEYYEKLFRLGRSVYHKYLKGLSDAVYNDEIRARFEDLEGYKVSLLRFGGAERTIADAKRLFGETRTRKPGTGLQVKLKTRVADNANHFTITFDFRHRGDLPYRVNVVIGYNGTGKTKLLSNLAIVASGYGYASKEKAADKAAGRFVDSLSPFKKVVVVSYSAFDTFVIPGQTDVEKEQLKAEGELFGYVYCGLRERSDNTELAPGQPTPYRLRTPEEVEGEFLDALRRVREANRSQTLIDVLKPVLLDTSFQRIGLTSLYADQDDDRLVELFRGLSSGHKIVLKILLDLTAHMEGLEPTLVLIDEPETHLHPPLLATLLKSVRLCLERLNGYAVIATHSPVVLQETPARNVNVLKRISNRTVVAVPSIETFGENIGVITQEVFNLDDTATDWHDTLRELAGNRNLEEMEKLFGRQLGFAARSYIVGVQSDDEG